MKTPQVPALPGMTPLGCKPYAQVCAERRLMASKEQKPCDIGLFSDAALQMDLVDFVRPADLGIPDDLSIPEFLKRKEK